MSKTLPHSYDQNVHLLTSVADGARGYVIAKQWQQSDRDMIHISLDDQHMMRLKDELHFYNPEIPIHLFPAWDCLPYDRVSPNNNVISQRVETLSQLSQEYKGKPRIILTTVNAIIQRVPPRSLFAARFFHIKRNQSCGRETLIRQLMDLGYTRTGTAVEPGEIAVRGSILDLVVVQDKGYRLDFFGDQVDSIRVFDPISQISQGSVDHLSLMPAGEVMLEQQAIERFRIHYREMIGTSKENDPLYEAISAGRRYPGMEHWLPLFYDSLETLFDFVKHPIIIGDFHLEEARKERLLSIADHYEARIEIQHLNKQDDVTYHPLPPDQLYINEDSWTSLLTDKSCFYLSPFIQESSLPVTDCDCKPVHNIIAEAKNQAIHPLLYIKDWLDKSRQMNSRLKRANPRVVIACFSEGSRTRLENMLEKHALRSTFITNWQEALSNNSKLLQLAVLPIEQGFSNPELIVISEQDIFGERIARQIGKRKRSSQFIAEASSLQSGELVVHIEHGIGEFLGLQTLEVTGHKHDFLALGYDGGDKLYVPVENIELVSRYGKNEGVRLDKLGGASWQSRKARLKERIRDIAHELLRVAALRELKTAPAIHLPEGTYQEFCTRFPYTETEEQMHAIEEVAQDLSSGKPMDRLVCGDVGFGKTEVALRAAFMAVAENLNPSLAEPRKQVAIIVPTTLLCRQHYHTFCERFRGMNITIKQLSRLVSGKEAASTRTAIEEGEIDIVIGTHALLSKHVHFKNLSLLIVDEEQHFGVKQKETLKQLRENVHVLTLTATPIPRTLQMAMSGLRELSLITTPPVDRLAIRTFVMPYDSVTIREAIMREHYRGGRSFYVVPRISHLAEVERKLKQLVPEVKIAIAHGQMPASDLDKIMTDFDDGVFDVLLCTTIVESGLDIPQANTLIVHHAEMFGLAQLYQIRGRIGRGKVRAYAYLTTPAKRPIKSEAIQRLQVLQHLDTLGAGFSIATHDMDIRGYGNLLGDEQSGHIKEVGMELYQQMLEEAIHTAKVSAQHDEETTEESRWSPTINLGIPVLIPDDYVTDLSLRLGLYQRLSALEAESEVEAFATELIDRFGPLPQPTEHLLEVMKIKFLCKQADVDKIETGPRGAVISFRNNQVKNPEALLEMAQNNPATWKLRPDQKLVYQREWKNEQNRIKDVFECLRLLPAA